MTLFPGNGKEKSGCWCYTDWELTDRKGKIKSFNITISVTVTIKILYEAIGKNLNLKYFLNVIISVGVIAIFSVALISNIAI